MATPARRANTNLKGVKKTLPEQILEYPESFDLDQMIYIIESLRTNANSLGESVSPSKEAVRIRSKFTMHQEGAEIASIKVRTTLSKLPEISINTISIGGINGPLPTPYTEVLLEQIKKKDFSGVHFLDIFHHRLASLWHRFRKRTYPHLLKTEQRATPIGRLQESLSGFAQQGNIHHSLFFDHFWRRPRSLTGLAQMLEYYFNVKITISSFEGTWRTVHKSEGSKIGASGQFQVLGINSILGLRCWDQASGFTIKLCPQDWEKVHEFLPLPGGSGFRQLKQILISYMGSLPRVFLEVHLVDNANIGMHLNKSHALGWNSWLVGPKADCARVKL